MVRLTYIFSDDIAHSLFRTVTSGVSFQLLTRLFDGGQTEMADVVYYHLVTIVNLATSRPCSIT